MKVKTLIALGLALIAFDAAQASFAASVPNQDSPKASYYPTGEQSSLSIAALPTAELPRVVVSAQPPLESRTPTPTWSEFGAGSHDESLSTQTRAEVSNQAINASHPATRSYFSY